MTDAQIRQNSMDQLSDEELVRLALCDREALSALIIRYYPIAVCKARKMAHDGSDTDDILQEGVMGLLDAVKSFDKDNGAAFRTYANICMRNRMLNAVSAAARKSEALEDIEEQQDSERALWCKGSMKSCCLKTSRICSQAMSGAFCSFT